MITVQEHTIIALLARRAKVLSIGMKERTGRDADVADYVAAFEDELEKAIASHVPCTS
jgi:hypothetical protein